MLSDIKQIDRAEKALVDSRKEMAQKGGNAVDKSSKMMFNAFEDSLKLFISSIKYQDPLDPVDTSEMAKQMFQLSQAQGQYAMLEKIDEQNELLKAGQVLNSSHLIGKMIEIKSDKFTLQDGQNMHLSSYLPAGMSKAKIEILDSRGMPVYEQEIVPKNGQTVVAPGKQDFIWNGQVNTQHGRTTNSGKPLEKGDFSIRILGYDDKGQVIKDPYEDSWLKIPTTVKAPLTGSDFTDKIPKVVVGNNSLPLSAIVSIQEQEKKPEPLNRYELIKATMAALPEEDQTAIRAKIEEQATQNYKLGKKIDRLSEEQFQSITKEIETRINKETIGE